MGIFTIIMFILALSGVLINLSGVVLYIGRRYGKFLKLSAVIQSDFMNVTIIPYLIMLPLAFVYFIIALVNGIGNTVCNIMGIISVSMIVADINSKGKFLHFGMTVLLNILLTSYFLYLMV